MRAGGQDDPSVGAGAAGDSGGAHAERRELPLLSPGHQQLSLTSFSSAHTDAQRTARVRAGAARRDPVAVGHAAGRHQGEDNAAATGPRRQGALPPLQGAPSSLPLTLSLSRPSLSLSPSLLLRSHPLLAFALSPSLPLPPFLFPSILPLFIRVSALSRLPQPAQLRASRGQTAQSEEAEAQREEGRHGQSLCGHVPQRHAHTALSPPLPFPSLFLLHPLSPPCSLALFPSSPLSLFPHPRARASADAWRGGQVREVEQEKLAVIERQREQCLSVLENMRAASRQ
eukprot:650264-Rhodomonas_salina.1